MMNIQRKGLFVLSVCLVSQAAIALDGLGPKPKSGMWEIKSQIKGREMQIKHCIDSKTADNNLFEAQSKLKMAGVTCKTLNENKIGNIYTKESSCLIPNLGEQRSKTEVTMVSENQYRVIHQHTIAKGEMTKNESDMRWLGACSAADQNMMTVTDPKTGKPMTIDMSKYAEQRAKMEQMAKEMLNNSKK